MFALNTTPEKILGLFGGIKGQCLLPSSLLTHYLARPLISVAVNALL